MTDNNFDSRGYDLDYYNLFLRRYLSEHRFPEAEDDLFIASRSEHAYDVFVESRLAGDEWYISNEKAMAALYAGFESHLTISSAACCLMSFKTIFHLKMNPLSFGLTHLLMS